MAKSRLTQAQVIDAIQRADGYVSTAAANLGVARATVYRFIEKYPKVREALADAREAQVDFAEGVLQGLIAEGNVAAVIFYLKTQGKQRGYVERTEVDGAHEIKVIVRDEADAD